MCVSDGHSNATCRSSYKSKQLNSIHVSNNGMLSSFFFFNFLFLPWKYISGIFIESVGIGTLRSKTGLRFEGDMSQGGGVLGCFK